MTPQSTSQSTSLHISWKNHLVGYLLSVLLIPLFGLGLLGLYWVYKRQKRISYRVTNTQISSIGREYHRNVDLANIEKVEVRQNWLQKKLTVADLVLRTPTSRMTLFGMENPYSLKGLLEKAVAAEKKRREQPEKKTRVREQEYDPGSMEKIDYLTGLWQQGLLSDEDYKKERKHFE